MREKQQHYVPAHRVKGDGPREQTRLVIAFHRNKKSDHGLDQCRVYLKCIKIIIFLYNGRY